MSEGNVTVIMSCGRCRHSDNYEGPAAFIPGHILCMKCGAMLKCHRRIGRLKSPGPQIVYFEYRIDHQASLE